MIKFNEGETVYIGQLKLVIYKLDMSNTDCEFEINDMDGNFVTYCTPTQAQAFLRHTPYDVPDETPKPVFAGAKVGDNIYSVAYDKYCPITHIIVDKHYPIVMDGFSCDYDGFGYADHKSPLFFPSKQDCIDYWKQQEGK